MPYNKQELLALPAEEKVALAEELWNSVENERLPLTDEEIAFAEDRLKLHEANSKEGLSADEFQRHFSAKYDF